jgi:hypothetical protein
LPKYRFTYPYPRFYPDVRGADGRSLMAEPGDVVDFPGSPPDDGYWVGPLEEAPPAAPAEAVSEVFPDPEPVPPAPEPEAPAPAEAAPEPPADDVKPFVFPGLSHFNRV